MPTEKKPKKQQLVFEGFVRSVSKWGTIPDSVTIELFHPNPEKSTSVYLSLPNGGVRADIGYKARLIIEVRKKRLAEKIKEFI